MKIQVDNSKIVGKIKPMHAVGGGPRTGGAFLGNNATDIFKEWNAGILPDSNSVYRAPEEFCDNKRDAESPQLAHRYGRVYRGEEAHHLGGRTARSQRRK